MSTENQKIPCGGFRIGDGLTMDGDTLKSLGGAYVKVSTDDDSADEPTFEFTDDSPLKNFDEIVAKLDETSVNLIVYCNLPSTPGAIAPYRIYRGTYVLQEFTDEGAYFYEYRVNTGLNRLFVTVMSVTKKNQIMKKISSYTLTPAT